MLHLIYFGCLRTRRGAKHLWESQGDGDEASGESDIEGSSVIVKLLWPVGSWMTLAAVVNRTVAGLELF